MRHFSTLFLCVFIGTYAPQVFAEEPGSEAIEALQTNTFRMDVKNDKQTMRLIPDYEKSPEYKKCEKERDAAADKPCSIITASLRDPKGATTIKGGKLVLAFLDLQDAPPGAEGGASKSVITLFDSSNTDVPLCFKQIDLMDKPSAYYYGHLNSVEARELPNGNFFVVARFAGGDGGDSWQSHAILHVNSKCGLTVLSKFYDMQDIEECNDTSRKYKFESDTIILIERFVVQCIKDVKKTRRFSTKRLDVNALLRNPKLRTIEP